MAKQLTPIHKALTAEKARGLSAALREKIRSGAIALDSVANVADLKKLGLHISGHTIDTYQRAYGMDAAVTIPGLQGNVPVLAQFLQSWLPGQVEYATRANMADELFGVTTAGNWEDAEVIQEILRLTGHAELYGDFNNVPVNASWDVEHEIRGVVRFEEGLTVGELEAARAGRIGINSADTKRRAAQEALDHSRNIVAFSGFNMGDDRPIYGFLNDPSLPGYVTVPNGAAGTPQWNTKTRNEIIKDLLTGFAALRSQSKQRIDPQRDRVTIGVASDKIDYLNTPDNGSMTGETAYDWLKANYPNATAVPIWELNDVNAGQDAFVMWADTVGDTGSDGGGSMAQIVQSRLRVLGIDTSCKVITEDFSNATSGIMVKRPYAFYRASSI